MTKKHFLAIMTALIIIVFPLSACDKNSGASIEFYIDPAYPAATLFDGDYATVYGDGKWMSIDRNGNTYKTYEFEEVGEFHGGTAYFLKDDKYGYIDVDGKILAENKYSSSNNLVGSFIKTVIIDGYFGTHNFLKFLDKKLTEQFSIRISGADYFYTLKKEGASNEYNIQEIGNFSSGLCPIKLKQSSKWAYVNQDNELVTDFIYDAAESFFDGKAKVTLGGETKFLNSDLTEAFTSTFKFTSPFSEGLVRVQNSEKKTGFADTSGNIVIDYLFDDAGDFLNGCSIVKSDNKNGIINKSGEYIYPLTAEYKLIGGVYNKLITVQKKTYIIFYQSRIAL